MKKIIIKDLNKRIEYLGRANEYEANCGKYFCSWQDIFIYDNILISSYGDEDGYAYRSEGADFIPIKYYLVSPGKINAWKRIKKERLDLTINFQELEEVQLILENGEEAVDGFSCDCTDETREIYITSILPLFPKRENKEIIEQKKKELEDDGFIFYSSEEIKGKIGEELPSGFLKIENKENETSQTKKFDIISNKLIISDITRNASSGFDAKYVYIGNNTSQFSNDDFYITDFTAEKYFSNIEIKSEIKKEEYLIPFKITGIYSFDIYDINALPFLTFEKSRSGKTLYGIFFGNTIHLKDEILNTFLDEYSFTNKKEYIRELKKILDNIPKKNFWEHTKRIK